MFSVFEKRPYLFSCLPTESVKYLLALFAEGMFMKIERGMTIKGMEDAFKGIVNPIPVKVEFPDGWEFGYTVDWTENLYRRGIKYNIY